MVYVQAAMAAYGAFASSSQQKRERAAAKRAIEQERRQQVRTEEDLAIRQKHMEAPQLTELSALKARRTTRDPFMEQAVLQGVRQQQEQQVTKQAQAAGMTGAASMRMAAASVATAQSQGLLGQRSVRMQREDTMNRAIAGQLGQLAEVNKAGLAAFSKSREAHQERLGGLQANLAEMTETDPIATGLGAGLSAMMASDAGQETLAGWNKGIGDWFSGAGAGGNALDPTKMSLAPKPADAWLPGGLEWKKAGRVTSRGYGYGY